MRTSTLRATPAIEAIPPMTPFIGPEQLMREGHHSELLRLGANESTFGPSPKAITAMAGELSRLSWYGDPESYDLRCALAAKLGVCIDNLVVGAGIDDLMGLAVRAFVGPGGIALATKGTYPTFAYHVTGYGGSLATVPYRDDGTIDVHGLLASAKRLRPAIVYVANPDNPSGTLLPPHEVGALIDGLPDQTLLLLDEAYGEFAAPEMLVPMEIHPRVVRTRTFSKAYGMAGARIGYAIAQPRHIATFQKIRLHYGVNRNAQIGALAALEDQPYMQSVVREVERGREEYYDLARALGRGYKESHTNFVLIDYGSAVRAKAVMDELLTLGVFVRKPALPPLDGYVRVTVGTAHERAAFSERLRKLPAQ